MQEETIILLVRWLLGFALIIVHAVTEIDGQLILLAYFLLGAPIEVLRHAKKEEEDAETPL